MHAQVLLLFVFFIVFVSSKIISGFVTLVYKAIAGLLPVPYFETSAFF